MELGKTVIAPTNERVQMSTPPYINRSIQKRTGRSIEYYRRQNSETILSRLNELDREWDTERVLEANFASVVLISSLLGFTTNKKWMAVAGVASLFMIQHAVKGWCPPLALIRRMNVRTSSEINEEKEALREILEGRGYLFK